MKNKCVFEIKNKKVFKRIAVATQKKVFSQTVMPRVLLSKNLDFLVKNTQNTMFLCQIDLPYIKFKTYVHTKRYDLGLYFFMQNNKQFVAVIDGNGQNAGRATTNIFYNILNLSAQEFEHTKKQVRQSYKSLQKRKLLIDIENF